MWQLVFASRHRLIHQQDAKRVPDGHGRSFGSWPWQKPAEFQKEDISLGTGNGGGQLFTDPSDLFWKVDHSGSSALH